MDYPEQGIACFRVKISQRQAGATQEYFAFKKLGGEAKALAAAKRHWRQVRAASPALSRQEFAEVERRPSRSGIVGVTRVTKTRRGREYEFWCASYTDRAGTKHMQVFSVGKYGERPAKDLAVAARQEGLAAMAGQGRRKQGSQGRQPAPARRQRKN